MPNFDFYVCLRIKFHKSSFWVLILAAGGPYWVSISQRNGSLLGPYLKAWGSLIVLGTVQMENHSSIFSYWFTKSEYVKIQLAVSIQEFKWIHEQQQADS